MHVRGRTAVQRHNQFAERYDGRDFPAQTPRPIRQEIIQEQNPGAEIAVEPYRNPDYRPDCQRDIIEDEAYLNYIGADKDPDVTRCTVGVAALRCGEIYYFSQRPLDQALIGQ